MTPEKYAKTESERMEGAKTAQSKTVYKANEPRGYPSGKCQREAANEVSTRETNERKEMYHDIYSKSKTAPTEEEGFYFCILV